jgi:hypothetical protein
METVTQVFLTINTLLLVFFFSATSGRGAIFVVLKTVLFCMALASGVLVLNRFGFITMAV